MADISENLVLPDRRTGKLLAWVDRQSIWKIALVGIVFYLLIVLLFSILEFVLHTLGYDLVVNDNGLAVDAFSDVLYFNLITVTTVGYGDFHPVSYGKLISVTEAFLGVGLFSILVAVLTVKALLPPRNTIVFSRYAYYCTEPESFLIIFVNTSTTYLVNAEISSYLKLGGDWRVKPAITSPFITRAVQTFYVESVPAEEIISKLRDNVDTLRVGLAGVLGFTTFSTSIQYGPDKILVIPNRDELTAYEGFWIPDFTSPTFKRMFHYEPPNALTLENFVKSARNTTVVK